MLNTVHRGQEPISSRTYSTFACKDVTDSLNTSVGAKDSNLGNWEKATWPYLEDLAQNYPEAGIHFQSMILSVVPQAYSGCLLTNRRFHGLQPRERLGIYHWPII